MYSPKIMQIYAKMRREEEMLAELRRQQRYLNHQRQKSKAEFRALRQQIRAAACKSLAYHAIIGFFQL